MTDYRSILVSLALLAGVGLSAACESATSEVVLPAVASPASTSSAKDIVEDSAKVDEQEPIPLLFALVEPSLAQRSQPSPAPFPSFDSPRLDQQIKLYSQYLRLFGTPDVLIVGSSRALQGIDPIALQLGLAAQGRGNLSVYNFSINGATARVIDLVLRRILPPEHMPQLIIWADGSRAINSGRRDATYSRIAASMGYRKLQAGQRPIQAISSPESVLEPAEHPCFTLLSDRGRPTLPYPPCENEPAPEDSAHSLLDNPLRFPQIPVGLADLDGYGFQSVATQFNPITYYRRFPRVSGRFDGSYSPFRLGGEQTIATTRIATFARDRRIPLVFVNLPLSGDYLDPTRSSYEQRFRQHMQQLSAQHRFLFRDLLRLWPNRNDYFADPSHINRYGAGAVALHLAADDTIPWPTARETSRNF